MTEREAIVAWLRETQDALREGHKQGDIGPLTLKHHLESLKWTIEAIERGDHWENKDG